MPISGTTRRSWNATTTASSIVWSLWYATMVSCLSGSIRQSNSLCLPVCQSGTSAHIICTPSLCEKRFNFENEAWSGNFESYCSKLCWQLLQWRKKKKKEQTSCPVKRRGTMDLTGFCCFGTDWIFPGSANAVVWHKHHIFVCLFFSLGIS